MLHTKNIGEAVNYIKTSEKIDVSSRPDRAVFYSGGQEIRYKGEKHGENRKKAEEFCDKNQEYTTLERTSFGHYLEKNDFELRKTFGDVGIKKLWTTTSERYAREASGKITAFVEEAKHDKIFRTDELKTLINNDKVTTINGVPREELKRDLGLKQTYDPHTNLSDSFHKIKDANVGKDLRIGWDGLKQETQKSDSRYFEIPLNSGEKITAKVKGLEKNEKFNIDKLSKETQKQLQNSKSNERLTIYMKQERLQIEQEQNQQVQSQQQTQTQNM